MATGKTGLYGTKLFNRLSSLINNPVCKKMNNPDQAGRQTAIYFRGMYFCYNKNSKDGSK